jgi:RNA polymerase sigma-70 factor (ECF subfamily)
MGTSNQPTRGPNRFAVLNVVEKEGKSLDGAAEGHSSERAGGRLSDEELFRRVREGQLESLGALVERYERSLFALLFQLTGGNRARAEDFFQETFLRAVRARGTFEDGKAFRPWLTTIALNLVRDEGRKRKVQAEISLGGPGEQGRQEERENESQGEQLAARGDSPSQALERRDEQARIQAALAKLPETEREVVLFHFYQGLTLAETAEVLKAPVGTIKSRLHSGLEHLRGML